MSGMLCLSRYPGERIVIPELGLTIAALASAGNRLSIGIDCDRDLKVYREEIWLAIRRDRPEEADEIIAKREQWKKFREQFKESQNANQHENNGGDSTTEEPPATESAA